jgi:hypothetical protein
MKWLKIKKRQLPEDTTCRNCGAQTVGRYCHECGQDVLAGVGQPILKLIGQALAATFALEGKTPKSLAYLLIRPGFLSDEYKAGKISKYVHPVTLFWMSTLIFFALLISQINTEKLINLNDQVTANSTPTGGYQMKISSHDTTNITNNLVDVDSTTSDFPVFSEDSTRMAKTAAKNEKPRENGMELGQIISKTMIYFSKFAPYAVFLLIPIFALLLAVQFFRKKYFYIHQLIFALHFHTFLWIFFTLLFIPHLICKNITYPLWLNLILLFIPGFYLTTALHTFYHITWRKAVWKTICISFIYIILVITFTLLLLFFVAKIFLPELFGL